MRASPRRLRSTLFALVYLVLVVGGQVLEDGWREAATGDAVAHYHAPDDTRHDCPAPPHDHAHCPSCKLAGVQILAASAGAYLAFPADSRMRVDATGDRAPPAPAAHVLPPSRAPPLG